jgi:Peptidase A4 family
MIPRLCAPLAAVALIFGSLALATGSANAAVALHPGTTLARPGGALNHFMPGGVMHRVPGAIANEHGHGIRNQEESSNWSGYAATGSTGSFNSVSSNWTEPTATCNDSGDEYAAFWVGLDGFNSDSVEQTGTDSDCDGGSPDYYGWYEMYPADPVYYENPVSPGDSMSASVSVSGDTYTLVLTDNSEGWTQTQTIDESGLSDSSAEVITEAPCCDSAGNPLPLANFGTVNYSGSTVNGESMSDYGPTGMYIESPTSGDTEDSTSSMDGSGDFSNTWLSES